MYMWCCGYVMYGYVVLWVCDVWVCGAVGMCDGVGM